jgi:hypothetical protein
MVDRGSAMSRLWRLPALVGAALALAGGLAAAPAPAAEPGPWTFNYNGAPQTFTVPAGVTKLSMVAIGAAGGQSSSNLGGAGGGISGLAYGRFEVTPGEVLTIWVGGPGRPANGLGEISWGFGCGAEGGLGEGLTAENAGGGGAASAVTRGAFPISTGDCTTRPEENAIFVVGGGGGGGGANDFVPPPEHEQLSRGGVGGDGGSPAGAGGTGGYIAPGGCGGCEESFHGAAGTPNPSNGGGAGGGGGGYRGGRGGGVAIEDGGGGGGGGSSFVNPGAEDSGYLAGYGSGAGSVVLSALSSEVFQCVGVPQAATVPSEVGLLDIEASGGHGGSDGEGLGADGGNAGTAAATVRVSPGEDISLAVGCAGGDNGGGWGYGIGGSGGHAPADHAFDGGGGGGSSAVFINGREALIAAGGGGGGGNGTVFGSNGNGTGGAGGGGGQGGWPATGGAHGAPENYAGGNGGEGGASEALNGESGGDAGHGSLAGGGGGGGAGWQSGTGGHEGKLYVNLEGGGGGGGGGGLSGVHKGALDFEYGTSSLAGNGLVKLTYLPPVPAAIGAYGGSKQQVAIGGEFTHPLEALVTDSAANPVADASVLFTLPGSGASGSFATGGTTQTVATGTNGVAISSPVSANLTAGSWEATAAVEPVSTPATFALTNRPSPTATSVTASDDPATPTEPVTFTATVAAASSTAGTPTGSVQFLVDGVALGAPVALSGAGAATSVPTTGLAAGTHTIQARYEGAPSYEASSGSVELPVQKTATSTEVTSSANPALPTESVTFTAAIAVPAGNTAYSGTVQFSVDGSPLGAPQAATNGTATSPPYETTVVQAHQVVATTAETASYGGSAGRLVEVVDPDGTAVNVGSSANPAEYGSPLELEAEVTPRPPVVLTPTGTVGFTLGAGGCTGTLSAGHTACTPTGSPAPGPHDVEAQYSGNGDYDPSAGAMTQQIVKAHTHTALTGSPAGHAVYGETVSFGAAVARAKPGTGTPTGSVQFDLDGTAIGGPVTLSSGAAESSSLTPEAGPHVVSGVYGGDADFLGNTGAAPYVVLPSPTTVALSAAPEPSQPGEAVTFSADVEAPEPTGGAPAPVPTGWAQFRVDGADFGQAVPLQAGHAASAGYERFEPGRHEVVAIYLPDDQNFEGSYAKIDHGVDQPTIVALASSANPSAPGAPVTVNAHVGPLTPLGAVDFQLDGAPAPACQAVPVEDSDASCTLDGLASGNHTIHATYSGAPLYDPSQGSLVQSVASPPGPEPPAACKLLAVRGRMLVYRSRGAVRLVARYRTAATAKVAVSFSTRSGEDDTARHLGTLKRTFHKHGLARLDLPLPPKEMKQLHRDGPGFIAHFTVSGDPGYCSQAFTKNLSIRRQVANQLVWFQSDSARAELPRDSR